MDETDTAQERQRQRRSLRRESKSPYQRDHLLAMVRGQIKASRG